MVGPALFWFAGGLILVSYQMSPSFHWWYKGITRFFYIGNQLQTEVMETEVLFPATAVLHVVPLLRLKIGAPLVDEKYFWIGTQTMWYSDSVAYSPYRCDEI